MIFYGKPVAQKIEAELSQLPKPEKTLVIVRVGENPASKLYISLKLKFAEAFGIKAREVVFSPGELIDAIDKLNADNEVGGIIIQLPLPEGLDRDLVAGRIAPEKDVDGFSYILNHHDAPIPPTVRAIEELMNFYRIVPNQVLIVGGGFLVGRPLLKYLKSKKIPAEILEKDDQQYYEKLKSANTVILATGGGGNFNASNFQDGATVIDASTVSEDNSIKGDIAPTDDDGRINIAPVPGGVGPITVACLFRNFFDLNK